jgi:hypothetical protein
MKEGLDVSLLVRDESEEAEDDSISKTCTCMYGIGFGHHVSDYTGEKTSISTYGFLASF